VRVILRGVASLALLIAMVGCGGTGPVPIAHDGSVTCAVCRMPVDDRRFASQLVTRTGKAINFDSIECLAKYMATAPGEADLRGVWVPDFDRPGEMLDARTARYLQTGRINSPMGQGIIAVTPPRAADTAFVRELEGRVLDWAAVLQLVQVDPQVGTGLRQAHEHRELAP
jgi:copper chaperone NosL